MLGFGVLKNLKTTSFRSNFVQRWNVYNVQSKKAGYTLYRANWKSVNSDVLSDTRTSVNGTRLSRERLDPFLSI